MCRSSNNILFTSWKLVDGPFRQVGSALRLTLAGPSPRSELLLARADWPAFMREARTNLFALCYVGGGRGSCSSGAKPVMPTVRARRCWVEDDSVMPSDNWPRQSKMNQL